MHAVHTCWRHPARDLNKMFDNLRFSSPCCRDNAGWQKGLPPLCGNEQLYAHACLLRLIEKLGQTTGALRLVCVCMSTRKAGPTRDSNLSRTFCSKTLDVTPAKGTASVSATRQVGSHHIQANAQKEGCCLETRCHCAIGSMMFELSTLCVHVRVARSDELSPL